jgi:hypothetical protein
MQTFSDFCSKNFNFDHSVKTVHKSSGGVKIENSATPAGGSFKSYTKLNFPAASGKAEVKITANGKAKDTSAKFEFGELVKGADFTVSANSEPSVTLEAEYSPLSNVGTKFEVTSDLADQRSLTASVNAKSNGAKATVITEVCLAGGGLKDYNFKLDYKQKNLLAQAKTSSGRSKLNAWVAQQCCAGWYWGAQIEHNLKSSATVATVGSKYKLDDSTAIYKKLDSSGVLSSSIEHKLANPALKVNAAAQFNLFGTNCCAAEKFGLGLTFGDF